MAYTWMSTIVSFQSQSSKSPMQAGSSQACRLLHTSAEARPYAAENNCSQHRRSQRNNVTDKGASPQMQGELLLNSCRMEELFSSTQGKDSS